jgi:hypothetical protein
MLMKLAAALEKYSSWKYNIPLLTMADRLDYLDWNMELYSETRKGIDSFGRIFKYYITDTTPKGFYTAYVTLFADLKLILCGEETVAHVLKRQVIPAAHSLDFRALLCIIKEKTKAQKFANFIKNDVADALFGEKFARAVQEIFAAAETRQ